MVSSSAACAAPVRALPASKAMPSNMESFFIRLPPQEPDLSGRCTMDWRKVCIPQGGITAGINPAESGLAR
jgi:hypothetical protein